MPTSLLKRLILSVAAFAAASSSAAPWFELQPGYYTDYDIGTARA